jgi:hypothetical protein
MRWPVSHEATPSISLSIISCPKVLAAAGGTCGIRAIRTSSPRRESSMPKSSRTRWKKRVKRNRAVYGVAESIRLRQRSLNEPERMGRENMPGNSSSSWRASGR